jgi:hypothetical protein
MGFVVAIGAAIVSGIGAAAAAVGAVIVTICSAIYTAVAWVIGAVAGLFAGIGAGVLSSLGILSSDMAIGIGTTLGSVSSIAGSMYFTAGAWIETLGAWFSAFLSVIHFDTLKSISDIAYVVSADYREYMNKVYGKIGEFSEAISGNAFYAIQLIENARAVVLDTSSMLGRPYDIGEITWIVEFESFLKAIEEKGEKYENNPYELINDINELVLKPSYDLQSEVWQGIFGTVDSVIEIVDTTVDDIVKIRDDIVKLNTDLPSKLSRRFDAAISKMNRVIDEFIDKKYHPAIERLKVTINTLTDTREEQLEKIDSLVDRMKRPAHYLLEGDKLSEKERLEDAEIYADLSSRIYRQPVQAWRKGAKEYTAEFLKIGETITKPRARAEWEVSEPLLPKKPEATPSRGSGSPFPEDV